MTKSAPQEMVEIMVERLEEVLRFADEIEDFVLGAMLSEARERLLDKSR